MRRPLSSLRCFLSVPISNSIVTEQEIHLHCNAETRSGDNDGLNPRSAPLPRDTAPVLQQPEIVGLLWILSAALQQNTLQLNKVTVLDVML